MGEDGEMNSVNGAFSRDGVIYITERTANGLLAYFNRIVEEEVGDIYAQNNGLENDNSRAQQIGVLFGGKILTFDPVLDQKIWFCISKKFRKSKCERFGSIL
jgi:hypothetical protein